MSYFKVGDWLVALADWNANRSKIKKGGVYQIRSLDALGRPILNTDHVDDRCGWHEALFRLATEAEVAAHLDVLSAGPLTEETAKLLKPGDLITIKGELCSFLANRSMTTGYIYGIPIPARKKNIFGKPETVAFIGSPDADGWIPWAGGENPAPGLWVEYVCRGGVCRPRLSDELRWDYKYSAGDIIRFRLIDAPEKAEPTPAPEPAATPKPGDEVEITLRGVWHGLTGSGIAEVTFAGGEERSWRITPSEQAAFVSLRVLPTAAKPLEKGEFVLFPVRDGQEWRDAYEVIFASGKMAWVRFDDVHKLALISELIRPCETPIAEAV